MAVNELVKEPELVREGVFDIQVCVPSDWTDGEVLVFANMKVPCGTSGGWFIRKEGSSLLAGDPERMPCDDKRDFVHITLDA